jgi:hypothetical protein
MQADLWALHFVHSSSFICNLFVRRQLGTCKERRVRGPIEDRPSASDVAYLQVPSLILASKVLSVLTNNW